MCQCRVGVRQQTCLQHEVSELHRCQYPQILENLVLTLNFFLYSHVVFSIVGNPLVCATEKETNCHGMKLMPMSMNLNNTNCKILFKIFE